MKGNTLAFLKSKCISLSVNRLERHFEVRSLFCCSYHHHGCQTWLMNLVHAWVPHSEVGTWTLSFVRLSESFFFFSILRLFEIRSGNEMGRGQNHSQFLLFRCFWITLVSQESFLLLMKQSLLHSQGSVVTMGEQISVGWARAWNELP